MASSSTITVLGNLGRKPTDIKLAANGSPMTDFSIAVSTGKDDRKLTTWYVVRVFGKTAELVVASLDKGSPALVTGRHQIREYVDKDGKNRYSNEILANEVTFVAPRAASAAADTSSAPIDDDVPF